MVDPSVPVPPPDNARQQQLREAIELFFETADPSEIATRLHDEVFVTRLEVAVG